MSNCCQRVCDFSRSAWGAGIALAEISLTAIPAVGNWWSMRLLARDLAAWCEQEPAEYNNRLQAAERVKTCYRDQSSTLSLAYLQLSLLPSCLNRLSRLVTLNVTGNQLTTLGNLQLPALQHLYADHNHLTALEGLNTPALRNLDISHNQFTALGNLSRLRLQKLCAAHNQLNTLEGLDTPDLRNLDVSHNQLLILRGLHLPELRSFMANDNQIETVENIALPNLAFLSIINNQISTLSNVVVPDSVEGFMDAQTILLLRAQREPYTQLLGRFDPAEEKMWQTDPSR